MRIRSLPFILVLAALAGCHTGSRAGDAPPRSGGTSGARDATTNTRGIERVTFSTSEGWTLVGELWPVEPGPAVILVHQLSSNHREWAPLVSRLHPARGESVTTLAIDLRGHGESLAGPEGSTSWQSFGTHVQRWAGIVNDVAAAVAFLRARPQPPSAIVIVGSSIGSSAALRYAASDPSIAGVALISPGLAYRGLDTLEPMGALASSGRRVLLIASEGDTASAEALAQLVARAQGRANVESVVYTGTGAHGVSIGAPGVHPEMWDRLERWVKTTLGVATQP